MAVGSAHFALGTDAAGSVRIPGAMTGVVGLKPTAGYVSSHGVVRGATAPSIDHVGILARSVGDAADVLEVIAGPDPADAATLRATPAPSSAEGLSRLRASIEGTRLAVLGEGTQSALDGLVAPEPDVVEAVHAAYRQLQALGATLVPIELPMLVHSTEAIVTFFSTELAAAHRQLLTHKQEQYHPAVGAMLTLALDTPAEQIEHAVDTRTRLRHEVTQSFRAAKIDALVSPTTPRAAMPLDAFDPGEELGTLIPYTCPFNLTGQPAISVPCGFTSEGMPVGLQVVGPEFGESQVLRVAAAYEQATGWHDLHPRIITEAGADSDRG